MKRTVTTITFNQQIVNSLMILSLFVVLLSGCQQVKDLANSKSDANSNSANNNSATNSSPANSSPALNSTPNANSDKPVEQANAAANANNQSAEKPPEVKAFETNLAGTWVGDNGLKLVFGKDVYLRFVNGYLTHRVPYRVLDKENVASLGTGFTKDNIKITLQDNNNTLDWRWADGNGFKAKRESNNSDPGIGDSLREKLIGHWVGITSTNSEQEKISIYEYRWDKRRVGDNQRVGIDSFTVQDSKTVVLQNGSQMNVSVEGNVMTVEGDGVIKKYNRQMTVD